MLACAVRYTDKAVQCKAQSLKEGHGVKWAKLLDIFPVLEQFCGGQNLCMKQLKAIVQVNLQQIL